MNKIRLLLEIIRQSAKAKIVACSIGLGLIVIGGVVTYTIFSNNTTSETISNNKEVSTTYEKTDVKEETDPDDKSVEDKKVDEPAVTEEKKKEEIEKANNESSSSNVSTKPVETKPVETKPVEKTPVENPPADTPSTPVENPPADPPKPSYKAAGIDWELTNKLNSWLVSKFSISGLYRSSEVLDSCKNVLIESYSFPEWITNGYLDPNIDHTFKYIDHKIGSVTFEEGRASDDPVNLLSLSQLMKQTAIMDSGMSSAQYKYCYAKYDGSGNLIISMLQLRV